MSMELYGGYTEEEYRRLGKIGRTILYYKKYGTKEELDSYYKRMLGDKYYVGQKFGKLTAEEPLRLNGKWWYICRCECGNIKNVKIGDMFNLKYPMCAECSKKEKDAITTNKYDLTGEYGVGWDSKGDIFYFDLEDYDKIKNISWRVNKEKDYAFGRIKGQDKITTMHRFLFGDDPNILVSRGASTPGVCDNRKHCFQLSPMDGRGNKAPRQKVKIKQFELKNKYKVCAYVKTKEEADIIENLLNKTYNELEC